ncbi:MAG: hypothetical protein FJ110_05535 [Deltaproteobacteria bacterium]|nr:hypothetical protein [Deltaproteobacteria bacterium]
MAAFLIFRFDALLGLILRTHSINPSGLISDLPVDEQQIYYDTWSFGQPCHVSGNYFLTLTEDEFTNTNLHTWQVTPAGVINTTPVSNLFLSNVIPTAFRVYKIGKNRFLFPLTKSTGENRFYVIEISESGIINPSIVSYLDLPAAYSPISSFELLSSNRAFFSCPYPGWDIGFSLLNISDDGILSTDSTPSFHSKYWERQPITFFPVSPNVIGFRVTQFSGIKGWDDIDLIPQPETPPWKNVIVRRQKGGLFHSMLNQTAQATIGYGQPPYPRAIQIVSCSDTEIFGREQYLTEFGEYYNTNAEVYPWAPGQQYKTKLRTRSIPFDLMCFKEISYSQVNTNQAVFKRITGNLFGSFYVNYDATQTRFSTRFFSDEGDIGSEISDFLYSGSACPSLFFFRSRSNIYLLTHGHPVTNLPTFATLVIPSDGVISGPVLDTLTIAVDEPVSWFSLMHPLGGGADELPTFGVGR